MSKKLVLTFIVCVLGLAGSAGAAVSLPDVIGDYMVLQQGVSVPIWGTANSGDWMVTLDPMSVSSTGSDLMMKIDIARRSR